MRDGTPLAILQPHTRRTTCILSTGAHVWVGSLDRVIVVIHGVTFETVATLDPHADMIAAICQVYARCRF